MELLSTRYGLISPYKQDDLISKALRLYGEWAQNEIDSMLMFIRPGDSVLDIGAYIGTHTLAFAKHIGPSGTVYSFEPQSEAFRSLETCKQINGLTNVTIKNLALGEGHHYQRKGSNLIHSHNDASFSLVRKGQNSSEEGARIEVVPLDALDLQSCDFLKIDVEGMEGMVLSGATNTVRKFKPTIFCETNFIEPSIPVLSWASTNDYDVFGILSNAFNANNFLMEVENMFSDSNEASLILIPRSSLDEYRTALIEVGARSVAGVDDLARLLAGKPQYIQEELEQFQDRRVCLGADKIDTEHSDSAPARSPSCTGIADAISRRKVLIAVPFYKNSNLVRPVFDSLSACADELKEFDVSIVFYNDSPKDGKLRKELDFCVKNNVAGLNLSIENNEHNLGFVDTINKAFNLSKQAERDIIILNSDTRIFPGVVSELCEIAYQDPMIGFVSPRSNNATICTLPHTADTKELRPDEHYDNFLKIKSALPRYQYVPIAVGFCLYIKWIVIAEFGGFDKIYDKGYNEENDLIMRANRCGYRAVLANHVFVWHEGEASFSVSDISKNERESKNRRVLLSRYPEYAVLTQRYFGSPEYRAEGLLDCLAGDGITIAFDFSSFGDYHNGTFEAGKKILQAAARTWPSEIKLVVYTSDAAWDFHKLAEIPRACHFRPDDTAELPLAVIRMGQPFDIETLRRLYGRAPIVGIFMLDTIAADCGNLSLGFDQRLWQFSMQWSDVIFAISDYTKDQLKRRYAIGASTSLVSTLCSTTVEDYRPVVKFPSVSASGSYMLIVGNKFEHKALVPTVLALAKANIGMQIVALGCDDLGLDHVKCVNSGQLSEVELEQLYSGAGIFVFPSHYEGFGFPLMHALARSKPVFVRDIPVFREIVGSLASGAENVYRFDTLENLATRLQHGIPTWQGALAKGESDGWGRSASQVLAAIQAKIGNLDRVFLARRLAELALLKGDDTAPALVVDQYNLVASQISRRFEIALARVISNPKIYAGTRFAWRALNKTRRAIFR